MILDNPRPAPYKPAKAGNTFAKEDSIMLFHRRGRGDDVRQGDLFRKAGTYGGVWMVECIFEYPDIPPHVRLTEQNKGRTMTVAADLLFDSEFFTKIPAGQDGIE